MWRVTAPVFQTAGDASAVRQVVTRLRVLLDCLSGGTLFVNALTAQIVFHMVATSFCDDGVLSRH